MRWYVVVDDVVELVVVVVPPPFRGGQSSGEGSGWPTSKAMTTERPCASLKKTPMSTGWATALMDTEIGF